MMQPILSSRHLNRLIQFVSILCFLLLGTTGFADTMQRGPHMVPRVSSATIHQCAISSHNSHRAATPTAWVVVSQRLLPSEEKGLSWCPHLASNHLVQPNAGPANASMQLKLPENKIVQNSWNASTASTKRLDIPDWLTCFSPTISDELTHRPIFLFRLQKRW